MGNKAHTLFLICGESGSGKDSVVSQVCKDMGLSQVISYTTRPRRDGEWDTHLFITDNEVLWYAPQIAAYTRIGQYQYFTTWDTLEENDFYIIDPRGIEYLKANPRAVEFLSQDENRPGIRLVTILLFADEQQRALRAVAQRKDDMSVFYKRCYDENMQFREFALKQDYDYAIRNINFKKTVEAVKSIVQIERYRQN